MEREGGGGGGGEKQNSNVWIKSLIFKLVLNMLLSAIHQRLSMLTIRLTYFLLTIKGSGPQKSPLPQPWRYTLKKKKSGTRFSLLLQQKYDVYIISSHIVKEMHRGGCKHTNLSMVEHLRSFCHNDCRTMTDPSGTELNSDLWGSGVLEKESAHYKCINKN